MLTDKMTEHLNEQINREFYSSNLYLQMSAWCAFKGLDGCAAFLQSHANEEMSHMQRLFEYVNETGSLAILGQIDAPPTDFDNIEEIFKQTFEHECFITRSINSLVHTAMDEEDYSTFHFLQWYVAEQHEEEKLFKGILDKLEIIGTEGRGLYHFDQVMARLTDVHSKGPE